MGEILDSAQGNQLTGKEPQCPSRMALRWIATGQDDQLGFNVPSDLRRTTRTRLLLKSRIQAVHNKSAADIGNGSPAYHRKLSNFRIGQRPFFAFIGEQKNTCPVELPGSVYAGMKHAAQIGALFFSQFNGVLAVHSR